MKGLIGNSFQPYLTEQTPWYITSKCFIWIYCSGQDVYCETKLKDEMIFTVSI